MILTSSLITITVEESIATSKIEEEAEDTGDKIREGSKNLRESINEKLSELGKPSNNYNDNENIQNEFDNSEDKENNKVSIADELRELSQLKKEGIITEEEFTEMKEDLIK
ncbi:MAG TPA: SHOCT domain-containing protein [Nitrososphaeraceae archaeon]